MGTLQKTEWMKSATFSTRFLETMLCKTILMKNHLDFCWQQSMYFKVCTSSKYAPHSKFINSEMTVFWSKLSWNFAFQTTFSIKSRIKLFDSSSFQKILFYSQADSILEYVRMKWKVLLSWRWNIFVVPFEVEECLTYKMIKKRFFLRAFVTFEVFLKVFSNELNLGDNKTWRISRRFLVAQCIIFQYSKASFDFMLSGIYSKIT